MIRHFVLISFILILSNICCLLPTVSAVCSSSIKNLNASSLNVTTLRLNTPSFINAAGNVLTLPTATSTLATVDQINAAVLGLDSGATVNATIAAALQTLLSGNVGFYGEISAGGVFSTANSPLFPSSPSIALGYGNLVGPLVNTQGGTIGAYSANGASSTNLQLNPQGGGVWTANSQLDDGFGRATFNGVVNIAANTNPNALIVKSTSAAGSNYVQLLNPNVPAGSSYEVQVGLGTNSRVGSLRYTVGSTGNLAGDTFTLSAGSTSTGISLSSNGQITTSPGTWLDDGAGNSRFAGMITSASLTVTGNSATIAGVPIATTANVAAVIASAINSLGAVNVVSLNATGNITTNGSLVANAGISTKGSVTATALTVSGSSQLGIVNSGSNIYANGVVGASGSLSTFTSPNTQIGVSFSSGGLIPSGRYFGYVQGLTANSASTPIALQLQTLGGAVYTSYQVVDDGTGKMSIAGGLLVQGAAPSANANTAAVQIGVSSGQGYIQALNTSGGATALTINNGGGAVNTQRVTMDDGAGNSKSNSVSATGYIATTPSATTAVLGVVNGVTSRGAYASVQGYSNGALGPLVLNALGQPLYSAYSTLDDGTGAIKAASNILAMGVVAARNSPTSFAYANTQMGVTVSTGGLVPAGNYVGYVQGLSANSASSPIALQLQTLGGAVYTSTQVLDDGSGAMKVAGSLSVGSTIKVVGSGAAFTSPSSVFQYQFQYNTQFVVNSTQLGVVNLQAAYYSATSPGALQLNAAGGAVTTGKNTVDDGTGGATITGVLNVLGLTFSTPGGIYTDVYGNFHVPTSGAWYVYGTANSAVLAAYNSGKLSSLYNTLDDGSGRMTAATSLTIGHPSSGSGGAGQLTFTSGGATGSPYDSVLMQLYGDGGIPQIPLVLQYQYNGPNQYTPYASRFVIAQNVTKGSYAFTGASNTGSAMYVDGNAAINGGLSIGDGTSSSTGVPTFVTLTSSAGSVTVSGGLTATGKVTMNNDATVSGVLTVGGLLKATNGVAVNQQSITAAGANQLFLNFNNNQQLNITTLLGVYGSNYGTMLLQPTANSGTVGTILQLGSSGWPVQTWKNTVDDGNGRAIFANDVTASGKLTIGGLTTANNGLTVTGAVQLGASAASTTVYTSHNTLDDGTGKALFTNTDTASTYQDYQFFKTNVATSGGSVTMNLGQSYGTNLCAQINFIYSGSGSAAVNNYLLMGLPNSPNYLKVTGAGVVSTARVTVDDGTGSMLVTGNITMGAYTKTGGILSYQPGGAFLDSANLNLHFKPTGDGSNSWNVYSTNGSSMFSVTNNPNSGGSRVATYNSVLDDGTGVMTLNPTSTGSNYGMFNALAANTVAGSTVAINFGVNGSPLNAAQFVYGYSGSGSTSNYFRLGFVSTPNGLTVNAAGKVSTSSGTVLDDGSGNAAFTGTVKSQGTTLTSDARLKENIDDEDDDSITKLLSLRPVTFNFKHKHNAQEDAPKKTTHGFIAQEVQQVFPELITPFLDESSQEERLSLDYVQMISVLLKTVQMQQVRIDRLEDRCLRHTTDVY